jgi:pimeloyl-ACP methyl ester carboxylesterase
VANARLLAEMISGSALIVYPGAGHGFLYQDEAAWADAMDRFLG